MTSFFNDQYKLVRQSRAVLLDFCGTLSQSDFIEENSSFGRGGSVRNLLVHCANTYEFWVVRHALQKDIPFTSYESIQSILGARALFKEIDQAVADFMERFQTTENTLIHVNINGNTKSLSPLELFTHVITHEFHHKGQMLSLCRHLGYIPVDTDIIR